LEVTRRVAETGFEDAGEVGELLEAEFEGDFFDAVAGEESAVGALEPKVVEPLTDGEVIIRLEVALDGALRNLAESGETSRAVFGADGEDFPGI
jgi:hypothetical protein